MRPTCEPCPRVVDRESLILATEDRQWSRRERIVTLKVLSISVAQRLMAGRKVHPELHRIEHVHRQDAQMALLP